MVFYNDKERPKVWGNTNNTGYLSVSRADVVEERTDNRYEATAAPASAHGRSPRGMMATVEGTVAVAVGRG